MFFSCSSALPLSQGDWWVGTRVRIKVIIIHFMVLKKTFFFFFQQMLFDDLLEYLKTVFSFIFFLLLFNVVLDLHLEFTFIASIMIILVEYAC